MGSKRIVRKLSWALLIGLLLAAFSGCFALFHKAKLYYSELNAVRLDPLGLREIDIAGTESPRLVFFGDSRAAHWPEPRWLEGQTLNLGISGQTTEQILARFDHHLAPLRPKIVLVQAGINDLKAIPLFPDREREIIERCQMNLGRIIERSLDLDAKVIITTIFPVGDLPLSRRPLWSPQVEPAIEEVNQHLLTLASDQIHVLPTADLLSEGGHVAQHFQRDFLHLNEAAYQRLNSAIRNEVEAALSP